MIRLRNNVRILVIDNYHLITFQEMMKKLNIKYSITRSGTETTIVAVNTEDVPTIRKAWIDRALPFEET